MNLIELQRALKKLRLGGSAEILELRVTPVVSDGMPVGLPEGARPIFARFFELFTDLPGTEFIYRDAMDRLHRLSSRAVITGEEDLARTDGRPVDPDEVLAWVDQGEVESLASVEVESLARIGWEGRFVCRRRCDATEPT